MNEETVRIALMYLFAALKQKSKRGYIALKDVEEIFNRLAPMQPPKNKNPYVKIKSSGVIY